MAYSFAEDCTAIIVIAGKNAKEDFYMFNYLNAHFFQSIQPSLVYEQKDKFKMAYTNRMRGHNFYSGGYIIEIMDYLK